MSATRLTRVNQTYPDLRPAMMLTYHTQNTKLQYQYCSCNIDIAAAIPISQLAKMELRYPHPSPTLTQNGGLQYRYCSCDTDITVAQNGTSISPSIPNPNTNGDCDIDIAAAICPSVPNHPHGATQSPNTASYTFCHLKYPPHKFGAKIQLCGSRSVIV